MTKCVPTPPRRTFTLTKELVKELQTIYENVHKIEIRELLDKIKAGFLVVFGLCTKLHDCNAIFSASGNDLECCIDHWAHFGEL